MDVHLGQELLDELGSSLESLEAQLGALLHFLKDKGIVNDEELAPYLAQAGNASNVRWRAARLRLERLLSSTQEKEEEIRKQQKDQGARTQMPPQESEKVKSTDKAGVKAEKSEKARNSDSVSANPEDENAKSGEQDSEGADSNGAKTKEKKRSSSMKPSPKGREEEAA